VLGIGRSVGLECRIGQACGRAHPPTQGALAQLVARFHGMEEVRGSSPLSSTIKPLARRPFVMMLEALWLVGLTSAYQSAYQRASELHRQSPSGSPFDPVETATRRRPTLKIDRSIGSVRSGKGNPHRRLGLVNQSTYPAPVASILRCLLGGACRFQQHPAPWHMPQVDVQRSFMCSRSPSVRCCSTGGRH
jgi:hypothetical protein